MADFTFNLIRQKFDCARGQALHSHLDLTFLTFIGTYSKS